ncbi:MAG: Na(+)-translocating NADH-quinone reductase subunit C [Granulosicoccaceae bacterium]
MFDKYLNMANDAKAKTIFVATALCLLCSVIVSVAAVGLRPIQEANKAADKRKNIVQIGGLMQEGKSVDELFAGIEAQVVDLTTGEYTDAVDADTYDQRKAAKDPAMSDALSDDPALIKRREKYATVYLVKEGDAVKRVILPIKGYGLWSTLYGFVAIDGDLNTISGLGFYEHAETPGLGGEVDNPKWKGLWNGKQVFDADGALAIEVVKGSVDPNSAGAQYKVDGLAGATLTSRGVSNLLRFWLGEQGFGPYLNKLRS